MRITLKACRINSGLTLEDVSKIINVTKRTLINYESGKSIPSPLTLDRLSDIYDVNYNDIFLGSESTLSERYACFHSKIHQDSA